MMPISIDLLPAFVMDVLALAIVLGPDLAQIGAYSVTYRRHTGLLCVLGIVLSGVLQTLLIAAGLGKLLQTIPALVVVVKVVGAVYLAQLGFTALRAAWNGLVIRTILPSVKVSADHAVIVCACLGNLMSPKALLFFSLFLPQQGPVAL